MRIGIRAAIAAVLSIGGAARQAEAQTDYYNTDQGRPVQVEDAFPVERYAFELQLAPVRLEREGGAYHWEVAPELAYGILPHTQLEVGFPLVFVDGDDGGDTQGLAGIEVAGLHNLNVETRTLPALALGAGVLLPVGGLGPDEAYASVKGIATRTIPWARFHLNGEYTFGPDAGGDEQVGEASRWMAGIAVDRTFPLRSLLVTADVFAEQPLADGAELAWTAEAGFRYQTSPQFNLDFGAGRRFAGGEQGWFFTFGAAHAFAVRSLLPIR